MVSAAVPETFQAYFEKGIQAYTQGHYTYAVDLFTFVVNKAPDATEARRYLRLATQKQRAETSPDLVRQLGTLLLTLPVRCWAMLLQAQGKHREAISVYEWLLKVSPQSTSLLIHLAAALMKQGMEDGALQTYEEVLSIDKNHLGALRKLARVAMKRGEDGKARQCFEQVLHLHPGDLEAQQSLRNLDALGTIKKGFTA